MKGKESIHCPPLLSSQRQTPSNHDKTVTRERRPHGDQSDNNWVSPSVNTWRRSGSDARTTEGLTWLLLGFHSNKLGHRETLQPSTLLCKSFYPEDSISAAEKPSGNTFLQSSKRGKICKKDNNRYTSNDTSFLSHLPVFKIMQSIKLVLAPVSTTIRQLQEPKAQVGLNCLPLICLRRGGRCIEHVWVWVIRCLFQSLD